jgi:hypothetical protein
VGAGKAGWELEFKLSVTIIEYIFLVQAVLTVTAGFFFFQGKKI